MDGSWYYWDTFERIRNGQSVSLRDYFKRTLVYDNIRGYLHHLQRGKLFLSASKTGLVGLTLFQVGRETFQAYHMTKDRKEASKAFLLESLRWLIGKEVGRFGFAIGMLLSKEKKFLFGFFVSTLFSALIDYFLRQFWVRNYELTPIPPNSDILGVDHYPASYRPASLNRLA